MSKAVETVEPAVEEQPPVWSWPRRWWQTLYEHRVAYLFVAPFLISFSLFIVVPVVVAFGLGFFHFNGITFPSFAGWDNFLAIFTQDRVFLEHALTNTFKFALIVGPGAYAAQFVLAWLIHQLPRGLRDGFTLAMYAPSMSVGVAMTVVWLVIFSGDRLGYLNYLLIASGIISEPILWIQKPDFFMEVMMVISLWGSMGVGFLSILAGLSTVNTDLYEAGAIDGIANRLQEIWYITIPAIKPQMLFSAVMTVIGTLKAGQIGQQMARSYGMQITPQYAGHLITNHMSDFAQIRMEFGYSSALSALLLLMVYGTTRVAWWMFGQGEDE